MELGNNTSTTVGLVRLFQPKIFGAVLLVSCLLISFFLAYEHNHDYSSSWFTFSQIHHDYWDTIRDDNFTAPDEALLCLSSAKILHRVDNLKNGAPPESICRLRVPKSKLYEIDGDIRIDSNSSLIFWINSKGNDSFKVKPFPRNCDPIAMNGVRDFTVNSLPHRNESVPQCTSNHSHPAIIFATASYTGNFFHDFTDLLIPLFLTAYRYHGEVQFLITDLTPFWDKKYERFLKSLSRYKVININKEGANINCYKSMTLGLYAHREFAIDPLMPPLGYKFTDFTEFMRKSYSVERRALSKRDKSPSKKPRLLLFSRRWSRKLLNFNETATLATDLGFEVIIMEGGEKGLDEFAQIVNSCDVIVGIHGAALSYMVFLPQNSVVVQIIPWGRMEGLCWCDYAFTVPKAKLKYVEYQASLNESSLVNKYPKDHPYIQDPFSIHEKGWFTLRGVYLNQDTTLDLQRFKGTLVEALEHVKKYK